MCVCVSVYTHSVIGKSMYLAISLFTNSINKWKIIQKLQIASACYYFQLCMFSVQSCKCQLRCRTQKCCLRRVKWIESYLSEQNSGVVLQNALTQIPLVHFDVTIFCGFLYFKYLNCQTFTFFSLRKMYLYQIRKAKLFLYIE